jgi:hypothetical protein
MDWNEYHAELQHCTLRKHGDPAEQATCAKYDLDRSFDQYEIFWRGHVVPCTNRPSNVFWRDGISPERDRIGQLSYSIWVDLSEACASLDLVSKGDLGTNYKNCRDCLKHDGDALQKFGELQQAVQGPRPNSRDFPDYWLAKRLNRAIRIMPEPRWRNDYSPRREAIISYRNYLVHAGTPPILVDNNKTPAEHLVLKKELVVRGDPPIWSEKIAEYQSRPGDWVRIEDVCKEVHRDTIRWLNECYQLMNLALLSIIGDGAYIALAGRPKSPVDQVKDMFLKIMEPTMFSGVNTIHAATSVREIPKDPPDNCTS